jgi:hypothetical protein
LPTDLVDLSVCTQIEKAVRDLFTADKLAVSEIGKNITSIRTPAADAAVISGKFRIVGQRLRQDHRLEVQLVVKNISSDESARRAEAHMLVLWAVLRLHLQDLGLPIQKMDAGDWREVTSEAELVAGIMHVMVEFTTTSDVPLPDPDAGAALLTALLAGYNAELPAGGLDPNPVAQSQFSLEAS